jgi:hypothetical protein
MCNSSQPETLTAGLCASPDFELLDRLAVLVNGGDPGPPAAHPQPSTAFNTVTVVPGLQRQQQEHGRLSGSETGAYSMPFRDCTGVDAVLPYACCRSWE